MTPVSLERWLDGYRDAWVAKDADAAAALFADDALYRKHPFEEPHRGPDGIRAYWEAITAPQSDVALRYGDAVLEGDRAAVEWWVTMRRDGAPVTIAGEFLLVFGEDGRCRDLREYWHVADSVVAPPAGWGA